MLRPHQSICCSIYEHYTILQLLGKITEMGVSNYFCFGQISSPQRFAKEEFDDQNVSFTTSVMEFMKPKCLWGEKKNMWKKLVQPNKEQQQKKMVKKELTLEEWFLASSPCEKNDNSLCNIKEGDSEKNWLYPHLGGEDSDDFTSKNSRDSFSLQRLLTIEMVDSGKSDAYAPCLCRSESSGKLKKRVSFRLPEEADIFIFCSPDQGDYRE